MNNNLDIFICTHKEFDKNLIPNDIEYKILKSTDLNNGDNLYALDKAYSEGSQLYYIWKNLDIKDYVGICHYRRWWDINELPDMEETFKKYDCIIAKPIEWDGFNNIQQYDSVLNINDLKIIYTIISKAFPDYIESATKFAYSNKFIPSNMFIMSKSDFNKYCHFCFTILKTYDNLMGFKKSQDVFDYVEKNKDKYKDLGRERTEFVACGRLEGHLLERLTNIFIIHNFKNCLEIPIKFIEE